MAMKILMVIGQFHPIVGGAERQCLKLSKALKAHGHSIKVLTVRNPRNTQKHEMIDGVEVERVWYPVIRAFGYRIGLGYLAPFFMWWRVYRIAQGYDVVHVHQCLWPAFAATLAAPLRNKPIVCKIGNSGERFEVLRRTHIYGQLAAWNVKRTITKFVWTSRAVYDDLVRNHVSEEKLVYIPNGVDPSNYNRRLSPIGRGEGLSAQAGEGNSLVRFIFTGTFTFKKNLILLLDAVNALPLSYRDKMKLILLGDGPDRAALTDAVKQYNLTDIVDIQGPVDDVGEYLKKSDVFVLPSSTEGLSNSALEAMAYGLPVILSNRGGNSDLVNGNGILIDPENSKTLCDAMQYMVDHLRERLEMGGRSRVIIDEHYAMEKIVRPYEELYGNCVSAHLS